MKFELHSPFKPAGGQPEAIEKLHEGYGKYPMQTLLGITGSGKTFVMANLIGRIQKPTLVLAHNKTLAAQLYVELKEMFPKNCVEYFISYYDYYQPESYVPTTDLYIEKDATINEQIEKMRLKAVTSLISRPDTIIVASISCIYGLGNPDDFKSLSLTLIKNDKITRNDLIRKLIEMQYERSDQYLEPGKFRARGDVIDIIPAYGNNIARIELFGNAIDKMSEMDGITGSVINVLESATIFPAKHFATPEQKHEAAIGEIKKELAERLPELSGIEAQRLEKRVKYDIEMIKEVGYCSGIENYSRHFDNRKKGQPPFVLLDYFPKDFLLIIDESHQTLPQSRAMYKGDYSRKKNLVDFGFRLPCAFDNRPLKFPEFEQYFRHTIFVSATPAEYELQMSGQVVNLIIRPTGLIDPEVSVRPIKGHIPYMVNEMRKAIGKGERILITTLTKRMAEDLTDYLAKEGLKVRYMHSDIESLDRIEIIRQLRSGEFDILVGINLLREGLDIPEVSLVCILDADKEGFLRNERSLIQTIGRAARNINGRVILFADQMTDSIRRAVKITDERRRMQQAYNKKHGITPETIIKNIVKPGKIKGFKHMARIDIERKIIELEAEMRTAAENLNFERAIELRDAMQELESSIKN
ncbi:MAG: excinuclease ABC subunit UvrB [Candidatus Aenigmarchaeota archaeon]|nr:excinuclease ABC subunit UvrB [Candidatus Aenigmarchaeota archaeon]